MSGVPGFFAADQLLQIEGRANGTAVDCDDHLAREDLAGRRKIAVHAGDEGAVLAYLHVVAQLAQRHRRRDLLRARHLPEIGLAPHGLGDPVRIHPRLGHERRAVAEAREDALQERRPLLDEIDKVDPVLAAASLRRLDGDERRHGMRFVRQQEVVVRRREPEHAERDEGEDGAGEEQPPGGEELSHQGL